ncbi:MAG TPA: hypothetical protein VH396_23440 [Chitinophagaceae bacterium]
MFKAIIIKSIFSLIAIVICLAVAISVPAQHTAHLRVCVFEADVTPPIGSPVAYAMTRSIQDPLSARGLVIFIDDQKPVVLCAVDWIGISNEGNDEWRKKLAEAAHTTVDRVSVHVLHQHDGVVCDFTMDKILKEYNVQPTQFDDTFLREAIQNVANAVSVASMKPLEVTHIGFGEAKVEKVASNRRILGKSGKVEMIRWSSKNDSATMAAPEGLVDPWLKCVSLWNNEKPIAVITYYATHPQSYYGKGDVTCEFIGIARNNREKSLGGLPHIHFNGAGGNITAGKYNDGSEALRPILANRVETAMQQAWDQTKKTVVPKNIAWKNTEVTLPLGENIVEEKLRSTLSNEKSSWQEKISAAEKLAWYQRSKEGVKINVSSLRLGKIWLLNLPGELFVEYQLAAQQMKLGEEVCTAAYEELGPGYIGTAISYTQGGYETSDLNSGVAPEVESVLMEAIKEVLK